MCETLIFCFCFFVCETDIEKIYIIKKTYFCSTYILGRTNMTKSINKSVFTHTFYISCRMSLSTPVHT